MPRSPNQSWTGRNDINVITRYLFGIELVTWLSWKRLEKVTIELKKIVQQTAEMLSIKEVGVVAASQIINFRKQSMK